DLLPKLIRYDSADGFKMNVPSSPWYMVLVTGGKHPRIIKNGVGFASKLLRYLLGGGPASMEEREELRKEFADRRTVVAGDENESEKNEGKAINFKGEAVDPSEIELPPMLR